MDVNFFIILLSFLGFILRSRAAISRVKPLFMTLFSIVSFIRSNNCCSASDFSKLFKARGLWKNKATLYISRVISNPQIKNRQPKRILFLKNGLGRKRTVPHTYGLYVS